MRRTTLLVCCAFASVTVAYPFEDSKTLFAFGQDDEVLDDTADTLKEVKLSFPVNFAKQLYGSIFVSILFVQGFAWERQGADRVDSKRLPRVSDENRGPFPFLDAWRCGRPF